MRIVLLALFCCSLGVPIYALDLTTNNGVIYTDIEIQNFKAPNVYFKSAGKNEIIKSSNFTDKSIENIRNALKKKDSINLTIGELNNKINILKDELTKLDPEINKNILEDFEELLKDSEENKSSRFKSLKLDIAQNHKIINDYKNGKIDPLLKKDYSFKNGACIFKTKDAQQQAIEKSKKRLDNKDELLKKLENSKKTYFKSMSPEKMKNGDIGRINQGIVVFQKKSIYEMLCKITSSKSVDYRGRKKEIMFWIDGVNTDKFSEGKTIYLKNDILYVAGNTSYKTDDGYKTVPLLKKIDTELYLKYTKFNSEIRRYSNQLERIKELNSI
ncbi:MAG: hypothetical protein GY756_09485 [bacterium]|nr:hypothetical protein [bacterium]